MDEDNTDRGCSFVQAMERKYTAFDPKLFENIEVTARRRGKITHSELK